MTVLRSRRINAAIRQASVERQLPFIRGTWYYVDPYEGDDTQSGVDVVNAVASIVEAKTRITSGKGDGIAVISGGTTMVHTTSFIKAPMLWTEHNVTVVGIAAPVSTYGRARVAVDPSGKAEIATTATIVIAQHTYTRTVGSFLDDGWIVGMKGKCTSPAETFTVTAVTALVMTAANNDLTPTGAGSVTLTEYNDDILVLSGNNNTFLNLDIANWSAHALSLGGVNVSGARNYFGNCHIVGGGGSAVSASKYSLKLDTAEECEFDHCVIGSDSFDRGNNADSEVLLNGVVKRIKFTDCELLSFVSTGTAHGAVKSVNTSGGTPTLFKNCIFNSMLSASTPAAAFLTSGTCDLIGAPGSKLLKFTAWGNGVYVDSSAAAASAGGGISTKS